MCKVYIARSQISPGIAIVSSEIRTKLIPQQYLANNTLTSIDNIIGKFATAPISPGEIITKNRIVEQLNPSEYLPNDPSPRIVPVSVYDATLILAAHAGQLVDIVAHTPVTLHNTINNIPEVIAHNAIIVSTVPAVHSSGNSHALILFAVSNNEANRVAGLDDNLFSLIFH